MISIYANNMEGLILLENLNSLTQRRHEKPIPSLQKTHPYFSESVTWMQAESKYLPNTHISSFLLQSRR